MNQTLLKGNTHIGIPLCLLTNIFKVAHSLDSLAKEKGCLFLNKISYTDPTACYQCLLMRIHLALAYTPLTNFSIISQNS